MGSSVPESSSPMKIVFLPWPTPGHLIPIIDLAKTLASLGVECTIITTPANALLVDKAKRLLGDTNPAQALIKTHLLAFPAAEVGLPPGIENFGSITSSEMTTKVFFAVAMLQKPTEAAIQELKPDCLISDMFYPWTTDFAAQIGVPRLVFHSTSIFSLCAEHSIKSHATYRDDMKDDDMVALPSLPHKIEMIKSIVPGWVLPGDRMRRLLDMIRESEQKSAGIVINTFYELEKDYLDHYSKVTGIKIWPIGPLSLLVDNGHDQHKADRGQEGSVDWNTCLEWLDQKKPKSVIYVNFGSLTKFPAVQLKEIAAGLEASGHNFLWVVRQRRDTNMEQENGEQEEEWSLDEFKERIRGSNKGMIVENWAPQLLILEHQAVGGMITHCGFNTILEGVTAGVPFGTWPLFAEQSYNERLLVDVLKIGVAVGLTQWCNLDEPGKKELVTREKVEQAVRLLMADNDEAEQRRQRARDLGEAAKMAVQKGGSSQSNILALIDEYATKKSKAV